MGRELHHRSLTSLWDSQSSQGTDRNVDKAEGTWDPDMHLWLHTESVFLWFPSGAWGQMRPGGQVVCLTSHWLSQSVCRSWQDCGDSKRTREWAVVYLCFPLGQPIPAFLGRSLELGSGWGAGLWKWVTYL